MTNPHPEHTKLRFYLDADKPRATDHKAMSFRRVREFTVDAVCEAQSQGGQSIVEVVSRRDTIHLHGVPLIEELLPNASVTMKASNERRLHQ